MVHILYSVVTTILNVQLSINTPHFSVRYKNGIEPDIAGSDGMFQWLAEVQLGICVTFSIIFSTIIYTLWFLIIFFAIFFVINTKKIN